MRPQKLQRELQLEVSGPAWSEATLQKIEAEEKEEEEKRKARRPRSRPGPQLGVDPSLEWPPEQQQQQQQQVPV